MPSRPSGLRTAEWDIVGPNPMNSVEDITQGFGGLGPAYTTGVDCRWEDEACLGPELLAIDLSGAGGTAANAHMAAYVEKSSSEHFLYIARGTVAAKYKIDDASVTGNGITLSGECTGLIVTQNTDGTVMVSYGMEDDQATAYHNSTAIGTGANDTNSANDEGAKARFFGQAPDNRVVAMGGNGNTQLLQGNVLTGAVDMDASAYADISSMRGPANLKLTGFAMDGNSMIVQGTNYGPYICTTPTAGRGSPNASGWSQQPSRRTTAGVWWRQTSWEFTSPFDRVSRWFKDGVTRSWGVRRFD